MRAGATHELKQHGRDSVGLVRINLGRVGPGYDSGLGDNE
jgi:hypothetical protein